MPERKSRTRLCEPKPSATPMIPAPAMSGPRLIPNSPRTMNAATVQIANDATLRSTVDSASTRWVERTLISPVSVSSIDIGVRRRAAPIRSRRPPEARRRSPRRIARRASAVDDRRHEDDRDDRERLADDEVDDLRQRPVVRRLVDPPAEHPRLVAAGVLDLARRERGDRRRCQDHVVRHLRDGPTGPSVAFVHLRPARGRPARGARPVAGAPDERGRGE